MPDDQLREILERAANAVLLAEAAAAAGVVSNWSLEFGSVYGDAFDAAIRRAGAACGDLAVDAGVDPESEEMAIIRETSRVAVEIIAEDLTASTLGPTALAAMILRDFAAASGRDPGDIVRCILERFH